MTSSSDEFMSFLNKSFLLNWKLFVLRDRSGALTTLIPKSGELLMLPNEKVALTLLHIDLLVLRFYIWSSWSLMMSLTFEWTFSCRFNSDEICEWIFLSCISFMTSFVSWSLFRSDSATWLGCRTVLLFWDIRPLIFYWKYSEIGSYFSAK